MLALADTWMTPHKQYGGMLSFSAVLLRLKIWSPDTTVALTLGEPSL